MLVRCGSLIILDELRRCCSPPIFYGDVMPQVKVSSSFNRLWDKLTELQRLLNGVLTFVPQNSGVLSIQARMRDELEVDILESLSEILECTIEPI